MLRRSHRHTTRAAVALDPWKPVHPAAVPSRLSVQGQPSSRPLGAWADLFVLTLGVRGLALLLGPLICPLPLLPHLVLAGYAVQVGA
jgi:hypothetical protein